MEFSTSHKAIEEWAPLLVQGRNDEPIAATKMDSGTDVNFGEVSRQLLDWLDHQPGCTVKTGQRVINLVSSTTSGWTVTVRDAETGRKWQTRAKFVFVGAGGGSLHLLQKAGLSESKGLGGFPIGGQWLVCDDPKIVGQHNAKVYGQPLDAAPTMAVPHLDTRLLDGRKTLLFGPFAAATTKFLHRNGSMFDLPRSIKLHNLFTLIKIGISNLDLVKYLVQQSTQSMQDRMEVLHVFYPSAKPEDWRLMDAGIRVQAIKKTDGEAGIVHYGTEVITDQKNSLSALLGASPGASTCVHIVLEVIERCFGSRLADPDAKSRLEELIPTVHMDLKAGANSVRFTELSEKASRALNLL